MVDIDGEINKIAVLGHKGPHPEDYHKYVFNQIMFATMGIEEGSSAYKAALEGALTRLKVEAITPGSQVNKWLTGKDS